MGSKFHSEVQTREGVTYLKISGVIDEDNGLQGLESQLGGGPLVINLSEIDRINSCGVRDWVNWLGRLERGGARPILVECAPAIVSQINLVHNFTGQGVVKSFYAPYFCQRCQREKLLLIETRDLAASGPPFVAPTCRCDECDGPMEFDDMEESYFAFLSNAKKVPHDPSVDQVMQELQQDAGKLRPRSQTGAGTPPGSSAPAPSSSTPMTPQPAAPAAQVGQLPSVPVVPPPSRPGSGVVVLNGHNSAAGLQPLPPQPQPVGNSTTPGTPTALAQQQAAEAQAARQRAYQAEQRSPLAWGMLIVLLLLAAGLLSWVFMTN